MVTTTIKLCKRFVLLKRFAKKNQNEMFCTFAGSTSFTPGSKIYKCINSRDVSKCTQNVSLKNFVKDSIAIKSLKIMS